MNGEPLAVLRRVREAEPPTSADEPPPERCELCAVTIPPDHRHVVNLDTRALLCACRPCSLLFESGAEQAFRAVPDRYAKLPGVLTQAEWDDLEVPVGLAFVLRNSRQGRTVVCYPGPAGATEADLPVTVWDALVAREPALADIKPDVEAVLVRAERGGLESYLVPIDACYELVGLIRLVWRGFDGGTEARTRIAEFFAKVDARCRPRRGTAKPEAVAQP